jgi:tetratricopeptide (TPR) repeat protein
MNFLISLILLITFNAGTNPDIVKVKALYEEGRFEEAIVKLNTLTVTQKTGDEILLYRGLLEDDAEKSVSYFEEIIDKYPQSIHSDHALFYICQYNFLRGSYHYIISSFKNVIESFSESKYFGPSCFCLASCYEAINDTNMAVKWYRKIHYDDVLFNMAIQSIGELTISIYSIQIGSFQNIESAKQLLSSFTKKGYDAWLATTQEEGKKHYKILVGQFNSREKAKGFSNLFSEEEEIPFWIVKIKKISLK